MLQILITLMNSLGALITLSFSFEKKLSDKQKRKNQSANCGAVSVNGEIN